MCVLVIDVDRKNMADCFLPDIKSTRTCTEAIDKYLRKFVVNKDYRSACRFTTQYCSHRRRLFYFLGATPFSPLLSFPLFFPSPFYPHFCPPNSTKGHVSGLEVRTIHMSCGLPLTVNILVECTNSWNIREKYFTIHCVEDLFETVHNHSVIDSIKETHFYRRL